MSRGGSFFRRWSDKKQDAQRLEGGPTDSESVENPAAVSTEQSEPNDAVVGGEFMSPGIELSDSELVVDASSAASSADPVAGEQATDIDAQNTDALETDALETLEPLLTDDDMPPIDTLSASSDLTGFFNRGVSAKLRRAALRHVFQLPSYNVRDGLNDYDDDFTYFEPLGDTVTSDMKWHAARKERERLERERLEEEAQQAEDARLAETDDETTDDAGESDDTQEATDSADEVTDEPSADESDTSAETNQTESDASELETSSDADLDDISTDGAATAHDDNGPVDRQRAEENSDELLPS